MLSGFQDWRIQSLCDRSGPLKTGASGISTTFPRRAGLLRLSNE
jgi:hypothetical protein